MNGGSGPNLQTLLPLPPAIPIAFDPVTGEPVAFRPVTGVFAPGIVPNPGYSYPDEFQGIGLKPIGGPIPSAFHLTTPGTIPTLQGLVTRVFDSLPGGSAASQSNLKVAAAGSEATGDDQKVEPKTRNRPLLNLVRHSLGADEGTANKVGAESGTAGKHRIGTPVRDLINTVVNGGRDKSEDNDEGTNDEPSDPQKFRRTNAHPIRGWALALSRSATGPWTVGNPDPPAELGTGLRFSQ